MTLLFRILEVSDSNTGLVTGNPDLTRGYTQPSQENAVIVPKVAQNHIFPVIQCCMTCVIEKSP